MCLLIVWCPQRVNCQYRVYQHSSNVLVTHVLANGVTKNLLQDFFSIHSIHLPFAVQQKLRIRCHHTKNIYVPPTHALFDIHSLATRHSIYTPYIFLSCFHLRCSSRTMNPFFNSFSGFWMGCYPISAEFGQHTIQNHHTSKTPKFTHFHSPFVFEL